MLGLSQGSDSIDDTDHRASLPRSSPERRLQPHHNGGPHVQKRRSVLVPNGFLLSACDSPPLRAQKLWTCICVRRTASQAKRWSALGMNSVGVELQPLGRSRSNSRQCRWDRPAGYLWLSAFSPATGARRRLLSVAARRATTGLSLSTQHCRGASTAPRLEGSRRPRASEVSSGGMSQPRKRSGDRPKPRRFSPLAQPVHAKHPSGRRQLSG
jgi:hypothetical protein